MRRWSGLLAGVLAACSLGLTRCGSGPGVPGPPSAYLGTVLDRPVPDSVAKLPLITDTGRATSLAALRGQVVVLADFLTLCQETCPLITGNLLLMDRAIAAAGPPGPHRGTHGRPEPRHAIPAPRVPSDGRGAAELVLPTGSPAVIARIWRYFGVWYQQVAEGHPGCRAYSVLLAPCEMPV